MVDSDTENMVLPSAPVRAEDPYEPIDVNIYGNEGPFELPIKVQDLARHIKDMKTAENAFRNEYMVRHFARWPLGDVLVMLKL